MALIMMCNLAFAGHKSNCITIDAWTFDRGNAGVSENVAIYGDYRDQFPELVLTGEDKQSWFVEYDIDVPTNTTFTLNVRYSSADQRPMKVWFDGNYMGECASKITANAGPYPDRYISYKVDLPDRKWKMHGAVWEVAMDIPATQGKHTLKFTRNGAPPNPLEFRLDSQVPFPKGWKVPSKFSDNDAVRHPAHSKNYAMVTERVPVRYRNAFLTSGSVNIQAMRLAIEHNIKRYGPAYPMGQTNLNRLAYLETQQNNYVTNGSPEQLQDSWDDLSTLRKDVMLNDPALGFNALLFVKSLYQRSSTYMKHEDNSKGRYSGGNLCVLSPVRPDGKVTELVPELSDGTYGRFDLSFDASHVLFSFKATGGRYRIYEIEISPTTGLRVPNSKLRQVTFGGDTEDELMDRYKHNAGHAVGADGFHDLDPCYLPNGDIMFASTRSARSVLCFPQSVTTLHTMHMDGSNIRCISRGQVNEIDPTLLDDGRVAYMRWEYVDKGFGNAQSLWAIRPDGSGADHIFKNNLVCPGALVQPHSIPNSRKIISIGAGHHGGLAGPVLLIDNRRNRRTSEGIENITTEIRLPGMGPMPRSRGKFREPFPFSEQFYLVSHEPSGVTFNKGAGFGIYALDYWGNRAELYRDVNFSCSQPIPVKVRRKPTAISPVKSHAAPAKRVSTAERDQELKDKKLASLFMLDVYQGLPSIERGRVKYVRVMEAMNLEWHEQARAARQQDGKAWQASAVSNAGDVARKKIWGIATVHKDGSARFTVPADKNLYFQVLDENYMELHRMRSFVNFQAGEKRSCIGCHEVRRNAPLSTKGLPIALGLPVQSLQAQPGDSEPSRAIHYALDIQPILDNNCISCHSSDSPKGDLDLTGTLTKYFNRSYENLTNKGLVSYLHTDGFGSALCSLEPPLTYGSHKSVLVDRLNGETCKSDVTQEEFIRIVSWIDANAPYIGTHRGRKNLKWKGEPDFRPYPTTSD